MIGQTLSHYRIVERLGAGGMGEVYRARDERLGRDVALKLLPPHVLAHEGARARLLHEARTASVLNHPCICTIHEVGEAEGQAYIVMEHVEGRPLGALIPAAGLPVETLARYGAQIADALAHAHQRGIIHRDLKSSNVVVTPEGRAKVLDFGLARRLQGEELTEVTRSQASLAEADPLAGTLPYMAPEALRGTAADARSDIWALGAMLYEMATGTLPFRGQTGFELSSAILRDMPNPLPPHIPAGLCATIQHCLAKEPGQRYQRASEVRAALEALQSGTVISQPSARLAAFFSRRWLLAVSLALLLALAALFGFEAGGLRDLLVGSVASPRIRSLAVLPLANHSGDPQQEYFVDGMTEAIITELSKIRALTVISRTSSMQYKGVKKPLPQIARELGVDAVIEGSALREGNQVRITVQLIHGGTDKHLWANSYQRELQGILALQSDVAQAIANEIQIKLTPQEQARLESGRRVNPEAYEAYLRGRFYWNKRSPAGLMKGIEYFQEALEKDPTYAPAYAGLADSYNQLGYRGNLSPQESFPRAKAAAEKALAIDERLAEAYASLGFTKLYYDWDWPGAKRELQRAIELNPSYAEAHHWHSHYLMDTGRVEESLAESRRALGLDPLALILNVHLGVHYNFARQHDEAIQQLQKVVDMDPNYYPARLQLGRAYQHKSLSGEAIAALEKARTLSGDSTEALAALGEAYAVAGKRDQAHRVLNQLKEISRRKYVSSCDFASIYAGLGERDQAIAWLRKAFEERSARLTELKVDPVFDPLRSDSRLQDLLRRMNFPP